MSAATATPRRLSTIELVSSYLQEHLVGQVPALEMVPTLVARPDRLAVISFLAGPFRFLCPADAVVAEMPDSPSAVVIEAADLVPDPYRQQRGAALNQGRDVVWFKGGRLEVRGCRLEAPLEICPDNLVSRGPRAAAPWIGATLRDPPAFFVDTDAAQLHFMRRLRSPE